MSRFKFELNEEGVRELMRSEEMQDVLETYAQQVAKNAGDGYEPTTYVGENRANVSVRVMAVTEQAEQDNYENNTLLRSL